MSTRQWRLYKKLIRNGICVGGALSTGQCNVSYLNEDFLTSMMSKNRLSLAELKQIADLVSKGMSINSISKELNKSKTTVYYHFRKIKGRTVSPVTIGSEDDELIGEFIGLFAGDGCVYKTRNYSYRTYLCFNVDEKSFVEDLIENVLIKLFGKRPMIFVRESNLNLCYCSKNIHSFLGEYLAWDKTSRKTYSVRLKSKNFSDKFIIGFIRGCLDSDGYLSDKKIEFATVSSGLMQNIGDFLDKIGISHSVRLYREKRENRKDIYHINILKKDFNRFLGLIKPRKIKRYLCAGGDSNFGSRTLACGFPR